MIAFGTVAMAAAVARAAEPTEYRLSFGTGPAPAGFTAVPAAAPYARAAGYGFEGSPKVTATASGMTADEPCYFSVAEPEGNYKVTVTLGDPAAESDTTVKAELRRLMLREVHVPAGKTETRSFVVNVRTPDYPGGKVHLKAPRESTAEAWAWDDKLTLEFNGERPSVDTLTVEKVDVPTIYLLGDSTVCDQSGEPYASWGQMLPCLFGPDVAVSNNAESGETLKSSQGAHRLDKVLSLLTPKDTVLIQYGHNDMKAKEPDAPQTYKATLKKWVEAIKAKGATVVLITPMNRHTFDGPTVTNSLKEYPGMVREAAAEEGVALVDLNAMSKTLYEALGPTPSIALFEHAAGSAKFDATHHSPYGAYELAKCVVEGLRAAKVPVASRVADDLPPFDPAKPDPVATFDVPASPAHTSQRPLGD
jgi:lysophospholipase L1-like esterase